MGKFANNFRQVLKENDIDQERSAMEASLDSGTNPKDFDMSMEPGVNDKVDHASKEVADAMSQKNQQIIGELQGWIDKIEEFLSFLNSEDPNSVQSRLAAAEPDTVMDKMKQSQQTKISRVASDLASLHQNFLGFMAQTSNARFRYVAFPLTVGLSLLGMISSGIGYFC